MKIIDGKSESFRNWERETREYQKKERTCKLVYGSIQTVIALITICIIALWDIKYAALGIVWFMWNIYWYQTGSQNDVIYEHENGYPQDGLKFMFKSWPWFIVIAVIAAVIMYF